MAWPEYFSITVSVGRTFMSSSEVQDTPVGHITLCTGFRGSKKAARLWRPKREAYSSFHLQK